MPTNFQTRVACLLADEDASSIRDALAGENLNVFQVRSLREVLECRGPVVLLLSADEYYPWLAVLEQIVEIKPDTRVVMLCNRSNYFVRTKARASGVSALLLKPLVGADIRNVVCWTAGSIRHSTAA